MELHARFKEITDQATRDGAPPNEKATCDWVIVPVLREVLGYGVTEIVPEESGPVGNRPDYTILPNTEHTWFLEAKAWSVALTDQHAVQATTYAHQTGKRWVVLTNGREWRLYDLTLPGQPPEKVAMGANADAPEEMEALLDALKRANVAEGGLEGAARFGLLTRVLKAQLNDPDSDVTKAIHGAAKKAPGLASVTRSDVARAVAALLQQANRERVSQTADHQQGPTRIGSDSPASNGPGALPRGVETPITDDRLGEPNRPPRLLCLPDGRKVAVKIWADAFRETVRWLAEHGDRPLPIPWELPGHGHEIAINREPRTLDGAPMQAQRALAAGGQDLHVMCWAYGRVVVQALRALCAEVGVDASQIRVSLK